MAGIIIDERDAPFIRVTFPAEGTLDELRAYYRDLEQLLQRSQRLVFLVDFSALNPLKVTAEYRRAAATAFKAIKPLFEEKTIAEAMIFKNALVRGIHTAFDWLLGERIQCERKFFSNPAAAEQWLRTQLAESS